MEYRCPYCSQMIKYGVYCSACMKRIDWVRKIWNKSACYYNEGLVAAQNRELSRACIYLQKAITLYHYNIEARNLLGLVYLEIGQVGEALKEWIISCSLQKEENRASYYIQAMQKHPKYMEAGKEAIVLYNRALGYLKQGSIDMAMIRLKKAISLQPKLIEARVLLALVYIRQKQYTKANEQVKKTLDIDKGHQRALLYYKDLQREAANGVGNCEKVYPSRQQKPVSLSRTLDTSGYLRKRVGYFLLGSFAMLILGKYLVLPSQIKNYQGEIKQLQTSEETLSQQLQTLSETYEVKLTELENDKTKLESEVTQYKKSVNTLTQKQKLNVAVQLEEERDYVKAAETIYSVSSSGLEEEDLQLLTELKERVYSKAAEVLYSEGIRLYQREEYTDALTSLESVLLYEPEEWIGSKTLYYLAEIHDVNQEVDIAKRYYEKVKVEYPDTHSAVRAKKRLEQLEES